MGAKPEEQKWFCVSNVGVVVPTPEGGSRVLKRGDWVEGEYYEEVAARVQSLVRVSDLDEAFLKQMELERRRRTGEAFPEEYAQAMEGEVPFDPRFDKSPADAAGNLRQIMQEAGGEVKRNKGTSASSKPPPNA